MLIKAAKDADLKANFHTYYANSSSVPSAMGSAGAEQVKYVGVWNANNDKYAGGEIVEAYKKKYKDDDFYTMPVYTVYRCCPRPSRRQNPPTRSKSRMRWKA